MMKVYHKMEKCTAALKKKQFLMLYLYHKICIIYLFKHIV